MKTKPPVLRYVVLSVLLLLLWLLQSFSACSKPVPAVIIGAVCGVPADISASGGVGFFSITIVLVCFAQASLLGTYLNRNLLTATVLSAGSVAAVLSLYCLLFKILPGADGGSLFLTAYLPRMLCTLIAFVPLYGLMNLITKKINR